MPPEEEVQESALDASGNEANEEATPKEDLIKNMKAEFARKTSNIEAQQAETQRQLQEILEQVQKSMQPAKEPKKSARELVFDDPEEFVRSTVERAAIEADERVTKKFEASQAMQNAVSSLSQQYPEFSQDGSEATALAVQKAAKLPAKLKGTAEGARLVMLETAAELGLVMSSRRKKASDDSEPVAGSRNTATSTAKKAPQGKVDEKTRAFAELIGLDFSDPKQVAALEKSSQRKNWSSYE